MWTSFVGTESNMDKVDRNRREFVQVVWVSRLDMVGRMKSHGLRGLGCSTTCSSNSKPAVWG